MSRTLHTRRLRRAGHTLLEMMLSLVLLSIVMASIGSAVMFASQAIPDEDSAVGSLGRDTTVIMQIAEDIANARYVVERSATAITVVVRDRTGDGLPDRVRYAWGGTPGEPLTYRLNNGAEAAMIDSVTRFDLSYNTVTNWRTAMGVHYLLSADEISQYDYRLLPGYTSLTSTDWIGEVIKPSFSSRVVSYKIAEIELYGYDGDKVPGSTQPAVAVEVRPYINGVGPGTSTYADGEFAAQSFKSNFERVTILRSRPILAGQDIALVCYRHPGYPYRARLAYNTSLSGGMLRSSDGGNSWQGSLNSMLHKVKAVRTEQANGFNLQRTHLASVAVSLQSGTEDRSPLKRSVRMLQAPQVADAFWEADFDADPTQIDLDGDGTKDWSYSGGAFPVSSLSGGSWSASGLLAAQPTMSFDQMVTADLRMRSTSGEGTLVYGPNRLTNNGTHDPLALITQLRQDGRGGQELLFYNALTPTTPIARVSGLAQGWHDVRLILLPGVQMVSIHINGQEAGTLGLNVVSQDNPEYTFALGAAGNDAEFASARVRVGGSASQMSGPAPLGGYALELIE